jgi:hypothetical protein
MAEQLLKAWGARPTVAAVSIQVSGDHASIGSTKFAKISDLRGGNGTISWTEVDDALPLPFAEWEPMWGSGPISLVLRSSDVMQQLNEEPLTVSGLKRGIYNLKIDGASVGNFNDDELARGVNLGAFRTPMSEQAKKVYDLTVSRCDIHNERWRTIQVPLAAYDLPQAASAMTAADTLEGAVIQKRSEEAQPKPHQFELSAVQ